MQTEKMLYIQNETSCNRADIFLDKVFTKGNAGEFKEYLKAFH